VPLASRRTSSASSGVDSQRSWFTANGLPCTILMVFSPIVRRIWSGIVFIQALNSSECSLECSRRLLARRGCPARRCSRSRSPAYPPGWRCRSCPLYTARRTASCSGSVVTERSPGRTCSLSRRTPAAAPWGCLRGRERTQNPPQAPTTAGCTDIATMHFPDA
jgi:hypothetical protein